MEWKKLGLVWAPTGEPDWAQTHATLPIAPPTVDGHWQVYVSCRDAHGKSRIGRLTLDASLLPDGALGAARLDDAPALSLGAPGTFDDSGVMPSWIVAAGDELRLYYVGWNVRSVVPYHVSVGVAVSRDGGRSFERYSAGPVMDRSVHDPFFVTTPCVLEENGLWRMWYASGSGWQLINGRQEPAYHIKYAESSDGISWRPTGVSCIDVGDDFAVCRPSVVRRDGRYLMYYSYRRIDGYRSELAGAYRMGVAESADGLRWRRIDDQVGIECSAEGWDAEMIEYGFVFQSPDQTYMLFNGNGFGRSGFGLAVGKS